VRLLLRLCARACVRVCVYRLECSESGSQTLPQQGIRHQQLPGLPCPPPLSRSLGPWALLCALFCSHGIGGARHQRRTVTTPRGSNRRGGHAKTQGGGGTSEREFQDFGNPEISDVRPATAPAPAAKMQLPSAPSAGKASKESTD